MCGIIGVIGDRPATPLLVEGLKRLEYRGYDSAGVATLKNGEIERRRAVGKLVNLEKKLDLEPLAGTVGIGHTRWATHGAPAERNAHPHATRRVAVVHNGIIENFMLIREELTKLGRVFESDTDTEAVVQFLTWRLDKGDSPEQALTNTLARIEGAFALGVLFADCEDRLFAARRGAPLAIGYGEGEMYLGSDALALAPLTDSIAYLMDDDWAVLTRKTAAIYNAKGEKQVRPIQKSTLSGAMISKGEYRHYMHKEICEQPQVIGDTLSGMLDPVRLGVVLPDIPFELSSVERMTIVACGTSYYAGLTAKYWIERIARVPVDVDIASEFRYRAPPMGKDGVSLFISQSGETADTLAALRYARAEGQRILSIVNVGESSIARESDAALLTVAGPEIGVASTKAFTTQLTLLACFTVALARAKGAIDADEERRLCNALLSLPSSAAAVLAHDDVFRSIAEDISLARDVLYLGRGTSYAIALEGALKLKEISYIHAEGYAAGELKHGPIALIDEKTPVIVIAPSDGLYEKTASNVQEVSARGGKIIFLSDAKGIAALPVKAVTIELPAVDPFVAPILYALPVQLLAYHVAVMKETDVDQPRNLAKSVTVE
ncbi:glutamine--fructose-6-phosphate aminotransferase [isomerizing] [Alphaproteobacteria bacterium]|nr:glutamine--fructose-6-phosphate aminotransferase [isomerizing] [Alphaproteobacteria bacterium]